jgi:DNA-binding NarL/FixJ family response regulator
MKRNRVLLADDDLRIRATIHQLLQADFEVVDAVSDGRLLVEAALRLRPDVIVTDIAMPKMNGIEAARTVHRTLPDIKFIFLTMHDENGYRREAQSIGAAGYVLKFAAREELKQAIHDAMEGGAQSSS